MLNFGDVIRSFVCFIMRCMRQLLDGVLACSFLYSWYNHGSLEGFTTISIIVGFGCILMVLYDIYLMWRAPYPEAWSNTLRVYRHWRSRQDVTVLG